MWARCRGDSIKFRMIGQPPWTGVRGVNPDLLPIVIANYRLAHLPGTDISANV